MGKKTEFDRELWNMTLYLEQVREELHSKYHNEKGNMPLPVLLTKDEVDFLISVLSAAYNKGIKDVRISKF